MICEFCGGTTAKKTVKKQHWLKAKLYIVENVESDHEVSERMNVEVVPMR
jgi:YgiT-type zinc finger domain-containing protein